MYNCLYNYVYKFLCMQPSILRLNKIKHTKKAWQPSILRLNKIKHTKNQMRTHKKERQNGYSYEWRCGRCNRCADARI